MLFVSRIHKVNRLDLNLVVRRTSRKHDQDMSKYVLMKCILYSSDGGGMAASFTPVLPLIASNIPDLLALPVIFQVSATQEKLDLQRSLASECQQQLSWCQRRFHHFYTVHCWDSRSTSSVDRLSHSICSPMDSSCKLWSVLRS